MHIYGLWGSENNKLSHAQIHYHGTVLNSTRYIYFKLYIWKLWYNHRYWLRVQSVKSIHHGWLTAAAQCSTYMCTCVCLEDIGLQFIVDGQEFAVEWNVGVSSPSQNQSGVRRLNGKGILRPAAHCRFSEVVFIQRTAVAVYWEKYIIVHHNYRVFLCHRNA